MSIVMNHAPRVEITLLNSIFATNMSAVGVATSFWIVDPIATDCEACSVGFVFFWVQSALKAALSDVFLPCLGHFMLVDESYCFCAFYCPPTPLASRPNSLADDFVHALLNLGCFISWR
jgi:hypothetical protein